MTQPKVTSYPAGWRMVLSIAVFVTAGVIFLAMSRASSAVVLAEPEKATVVKTPAAVLSDAAASAGKSIKFGSALSPSGEAMPVGNIPGFKQVEAEDFTKVATTSTFNSVYADSWCPYDDGTGNKYYFVTSAVSGMMRINLDGTKGAAGSFGPSTPNGTSTHCWRRSYGKVILRIKVTGATGYGAANMVWPSSNIWGEGEVDYPEGDFKGNMNIFQHGINCTDCSANIASLDTGKKWTDWHTVSTEWTAAGIKYFMDGVLIKTVTTSVPFNNHRYTLQMAKTSSDMTPGTFDIDWVAVYDYAP